MHATIPCLVAVLAGFARPASCQDKKKTERTSALESALNELSLDEPSVRAAPAAPQAGGPQVPKLNLLDISLDLLTTVGTSTEPDSVIEQLQGGGHDPKKRGFTLQQAELALQGAVDPWFRLNADLIYFIEAATGESRVELEEAFLTTTSLPEGLELEVGQSFTEFGRINPRHPHAWDFIDQPFILTRMFGGDGMRGPGARLGWLAPLPWLAEVHVSAQNANGETMTSFVSDAPPGGRPAVQSEVRGLQDLVYLLRLDNAFEIGDGSELHTGASFLTGPNSTGGRTWIYGADVVFVYRPATQRRGWPFLKVQGEVVGRSYQAEAFNNGKGLVFPKDTLHDHGFYLQGLWGFSYRWMAGLRFEHAQSNGPSTDPLRTDRFRITPLITFQPSEFSRIRLQYGYDDSDHLGHVAHSVWLGFEVLIGAHPAHTL